MTRFLFSLIGVWLILWGGKLQAQLVVTNGASLNILSGETVTLSGTNLQNNAGGTISHQGTLRVAGNTTNRDVINNGTFNGASGIIEMLGVNEQQIQGSAVLNIGDFVINNGGNGVSITNTGGLRIHNALTLTNGRLFASDNSPVYFTPSANSPTETNANHIRGTAIMEARTVGTAAFPTFLMFSMPAGGDVGNLTLTRRSGDGTTTSRGFTPTAGTALVGASESLDVHWIVNITNTTGNRDATFSWISDWDNGKSLTQMQLWRTAPANINTSWFIHNAGLLDLSATRSHTQTNIPLTTLHNAWTLSDLVNPLPVDMFAFSVRVVKGKDVEIVWTTQNEYNLQRYQVERSLDGLNFEAIASVNAQNQKNNQYLHTDLNAKDLGKEVLYYRIKMIEQNGASRNSAIKAAHFNKEFWANIFPNPFKDDLNIKIFNPERKNIKITLIDNIGRTHLNAILEGEEIFYQLNTQINGLAAGAYFLQISTDTQTEIVKLIKQ
ncbi:T9SS type A sorting domain-containing protein [Raineya sp.]